MICKLVQAQTIQQYKREFLFDTALQWAIIGPRIFLWPPYYLQWAIIGTGIFLWPPLLQWAIIVPGIFPGPPLQWAITKSGIFWKKVFEKFLNEKKKNGAIHFTYVTNDHLVDTSNFKIENLADEMKLLFRRCWINRTFLYC